MASLEVDTSHETGFEDDRCPRCGLERKRWQNPEKGFLKLKDRFCCQGCAIEIGCTCVGVPEEKIIPQPGIKIEHRCAFQERKEQKPLPPGQPERRSSYQKRDN